MCQRCAPFYDQMSVSARFFFFLQSKQKLGAAKTEEKKHANLYSGRILKKNKGVGGVGGDCGGGKKKKNKKSNAVENG